MTDNREDRVRRISRGAPSPHIVLRDHLAYVKCSDTLELGEDPQPGQNLARVEPVQDDRMSPGSVSTVGDVDVEGHIHAVGSLRGDLQCLAHRLEYAATANRAGGISREPTLLAYTQLLGLGDVRPVQSPPDHVSYCLVLTYAAREGAVIQTAHVAELVPEVEMTVDVQKPDLRTGLSGAKPAREAYEGGVGPEVVAADHDRRRAARRDLGHGRRDRLDLRLHIALVDAYVADVEQARLLGHRPYAPVGDVYVTDGLGLQAVIAGQVQRRLADRSRRIALTVASQRPGVKRNAQHRHAACGDLPDVERGRTVKGGRSRVPVNGVALGHQHSPPVGSLVGSPSKRARDMCPPEVCLPACQ